MIKLEVIASFCKLRKFIEKELENVVETTKYLDNNRSIETYMTLESAKQPAVCDKKTFKRNSSV